MSLRNVVSARSKRKKSSGRKSMGRKIKKNREIDPESIISRNNRSSGFELYRGLNSIPQIFDHVTKKYENKILYLFRNVKTTTIENEHETGLKFVTKEYGPIETVTHKKNHDMVEWITTGIKTFDTKLKFGSKVGLFLNHHILFMTIAISLFRAGIVVVTASPSSHQNVEEMYRIIDQCRLSMVICSKNMVKDLDLLAERCTCLKRLVVVGKQTTNNDDHYQSMYFKVKTIDQIMKDGKDRKIVPMIPQRDDLALIMYTPGTTQEPKGVMLTHNNICCQFLSLKKSLMVTSRDTYLSHQSPSNIFEMIMHLLFLFSGSKIAFGNTSTLFKQKGGAKNLGDLSCFRPTVFVGIPSVFKTFQNLVMKEVNNSGIVHRKMFENINDRKKWYLYHDDKCKPVSVFGESTVLGKYRKKYSPRIRLLISHSSHLSEPDQIFLQNILGSECKVRQCYCSTETGICILQSCSIPKFIPNTIGHPLEHCEIKLLPKQKSESGELFIRSPSVAFGYYKMPTETRQNFQSDGWFRTGDICEKKIMHQKNKKLLLPLLLTFIDRKKSLVKLSSGEVIAPGFLQNTVYRSSNSSYINSEQICVVGNPFKEYLIAMVFLKDQPKLLLEEELVIIKSEILENFQKLAEMNKRRKCEFIKDILILKKEKWTAQNGMITSLNNIKRRNVYQRYKHDLVKIFK